MTGDIALRYLDSRLQDLQVKEYKLDYQHISIPANNTKTYYGEQNSLWVLVGENENISISSDDGDFDLSNPYLEEQDEEHSGVITITNKAFTSQQVKFIRAIFK